MLGVAFIVAVVIGLAYVARRNHQPRAIGAFRNRPTGSSPAPIMFADGTGDYDTDDHDGDGRDAGSADSSDAGGGDCGDSGGGGDGGGGGGRSE